MARDKLGTMWTGLGLIALGIALLVAQWIGWGEIWPLFPLLAGLSFWGGYVATGFKDGGLVFVGTTATLIGLFFFGFTLGYWEWAEMSTLWPVFPLIGGVAFFILFLAERDLGALAVGCIALTVGLVGLAVTFGFVGSDIVKLWPLLLVFGGLVGLASAVSRMLRRE
jgi:hypothetical protein